MIENSNRIKIEYYLCKQIIETHTNIINELNVILKEKDGYKYNSKNKKIKKHFPASVNIDKDTYKFFLTKELSKNRKVSYSLSSKTVPEQIDNILFTAIRRYNTMNMFNDKKNLLEILIEKNIGNFPALTPLDLRHNLSKYKCVKDIKNKYPGYFDKNNRLFYDVIYTIKTENVISFVDANNKTFCDTILICCHGKIFNIMFELDMKNPYYSELTNMSKNHTDNFDFFIDA
jgi:hypothetical protein